jgi:hypothetical protein
VKLCGAHYNPALDQTLATNNFLPTTFCRPDCR